MLTLALAEQQNSLSMYAVCNIENMVDGELIFSGLTCCIAFPENRVTGVRENTDVL